MVRAVPENGDEPVHVEGQEHRLAAILVGDVAGYTRLIAEDEDHTVRTLAAYQQEIELLVRQHRGRLVDFAAGDGFLAEFPSAVYAVRSALEIQDVLRARNSRLPEEKRLEFRLGAHIGDVRVEGERLVGSGVNVAARLEPLAEPGGLCISERIREDIRGRLELDLEDLGPQELKDVPEPVRAFSVMPGVSLLTEAAESTRPQSSTSRWKLGFVAGAITAVVAAGWLFSIREPQPSLPGPIRSIAILPLDNLSGDPEQEFFSDGMTDALITEISQLGTLRVTSWTTSKQFKGTSLTTPEIASTLGVDGVVSGSVFLAGDDVRIQAQLIHGASDSVVWSDSYERPLVEVLRLQRDVATTISHRIGLETADRKAAKLVDPQAYRAFLRGEYSLEREDHQTALMHFDQAIEFDGDWAPPHAGRAATYGSLVLFGLVDPQDALREMRASVSRALELDDGLADAHAALGAVLWYEWDWEGANRAYLRAIELDPSDTMNRGWYTVFLFDSGRPEESLRQSQLGLELDPASNLFAVFAGSYSSTWGESSEQAATTLRELIGAYGETGIRRHALGVALFESGQVRESIVELRRSIDLGFGDSSRSVLGSVLAQSGERDEAESIVEDLIRQRTERYVSPIFIAQVFAGLKDADRSFEWLFRGVEERDHQLAAWLVGHWYAWGDLPSDPRWNEVLLLINHPAAQRE